MNGKRAKALRRLAAKVTQESPSGLMETHYMALPSRGQHVIQQIRVLGYSARAVYQDLKQNLASDRTVDIEQAIR